MDLESANFFLTNSIDWPIVISVITLIILLFLSALISGSEIAFFSLSKTDLESDKNVHKNKKIVIDLLSNPQKLLATILISNNFINILFILIFAYTGDYFFGNIQSKILKFLIEIVLVTSLILLFGEVLPKVYASRNALKFSYFMAKPLKVLNVFLSFLSIPLLK